MIEFIITQWVMVGLVALWFLVCIVTVANMHYRDLSTWHGNFILIPRNFLKDCDIASRTPVLPRDKCSYFWSMFVWTPAVWVLVLLVSAIGLIVGLGLLCFVAITVCGRLLSHWILYPLLGGKYVIVRRNRGRSTAPLLSWREAAKLYANSLVQLNDLRKYEYSVEGKIPKTRVPPILWLLALTLMYETITNWPGVWETAVSSFGWLMRIVVVLILIFVVTKTWTKIKTTVAYVREKTCYKLPEVPE